MGEVNPSILFYFTIIIFVYLLIVVTSLVEFIFLNSTNLVWSNLVLFLFCLICFAGRKIVKGFNKKNQSGVSLGQPNPASPSSLARSSPSSPPRQQPARAPFFFFFAHCHVDPRRQHRHHAPLTSPFFLLPSITPPQQRQEITGV